MFNRFWFYRSWFYFFPASLFYMLLFPIVLVADEPVDFAHQITPILKKHCTECHAGEEAKGGFSMKDRILFLESESVELGDPDSSRLFQLIVSSDAEDQMPPSDHERLNAKEIELIRRWISQDLPWDAGFTFGERGYEPPLKPRLPELPPQSAPGRGNPIDRIIDQYAGDNDAPIAEPISDSQFIRRVYLDVIGRLPTVDQLSNFENDQSPNSRDHLVSQLLGQYEMGDQQTYDFDYAEHWLSFWNDLLRNTYTGTGTITGGRKQITNWLYRSLLKNKPYDQFVRELISPTGESEGFIKGIKWRGTVNSSQTVDMQFAQNITQSFLGINMKCASCHDSFIDRWTLQETYALASIHADKPLELHRCDKALGKTAQPAWLFPELGQVDPNADRAKRLQQLAELMTHRDNGRLTRTIANRIWHRLMGRGIAHPVDALHTKPWNEDLLDYLAYYLAENDYDLKKLIGLICRSQAYQSKVARTKGQQVESEFVVRGPRSRRMTAEQFVDAVWQLTGSAPQSYDAKVSRLRPVSSDSVNPDAGGESAEMQMASWIWTDANSRQAAAGAEFTFSLKLNLEEQPVAGLVTATCDNEFRLYVNNVKVAEGTEWTSLQTAGLANALKAGKNRILIVGKNAGSSPNPAGLFFHAVLRFRDGAVKHVRSNDQWKWSKTKLNARGRFKKEPTDWESAVEVSSQTWGEPILAQAAALIRNGETSALLPVRASLVKNNDLMKSLGRPNRDQVVTSRPATLTTLEAIDLANGQRLFDWIEDGARNSIAKHKTSTELVRWLYKSAFSRDPTQSEMSLASEIIGETPTETGVQDLFWAVLMMPEFQFIR